MCTLLTNKRYELLYNCGIQLLHIGRPLAAFECLIEAVQVYHANPRLWLRLAECCIAANKGVSAAWVPSWTLTLHPSSPLPPRTPHTVTWKAKNTWEPTRFHPLFNSQGIYRVFCSLIAGQKILGSESHLLTFWFLVSMATGISTHIKELKPTRSYLLEQWSASC